MTQTPATSTVPPALPKDLTPEVQAWRRQLLDTTKRNRLINARLDPRSGLLPVLHPSFFDLWEHTAIKGKSLSFDEPSDAPDKSQAITPLLEKALDNKLKRLELAARTSLSEQGVNTLFLAFGFLSWYETADATAPVLSPLVLLPVTLEKPAIDSPWLLHPSEEDLAPNHPITELLRSQFSLTLPELDEEALRASPESLQTYLSQVQAAIATRDRWSITLAAGLGTFAFQKVSMWQDLGTNEAQVTAHPVCRALAGDADPMRALATPDPQGPLDQRATLAAAHVILDCDSSQHEAIELVKQGKSLVLDGPPGTGKSQTIANIIAQCLADGKTVLFVSEKAAALEVVKRRLDARNLGGFCLECHSHKANKRAVVQDLERALTAKPELYPPMDDELAGLTASRDALSSYVHALHAPRAALQISAYDAHGLYVRARQAPATRQAFENTHAVDRAHLRQLHAAIEALIACRDVIENQSSHPWRHANVISAPLSLPDDIRHHFAAAAKALQDALPSLAVLCAENFLPADPSLSQITPAADEAAKLHAHPAIPPNWVPTGLLATAQRYTQLHALSESYAQTHQTLGSFRENSLLNADTQLFQAAAQTHPALKSALPTLSSDIRAQPGLLQSTQNALQTLSETIQQAAALTKAVHQQLTLAPQNPATLDSILAFAAAARIAVALRPANPAWFTPAGIARLAATAHQATELSALAQGIRTQLENHTGLLPTAFTRAALPHIKEALRHDSFFSRLSGSWKRAKRSLAPFYKSAQPFWGSDIVDHMFQLDQWHTYQEQIHTLLSGDAVFFQTLPGQEPDFSRNAETIKAFQSLNSDFVSLEGCAARLTAATPDDVLALKKSLVRIQELAQSAQSGIDALSKSVNFSHVLRGTAPSLLSLSEFSTLIAEFSATLKAQSDRLVHILDLAEPPAHKADTIQIDALAAHAAAIQNLVHTRRQAQPLAAALGVSLPETNAPNLGGWRTQANLAKWLTDFAAAHNGVIPDRFIRPLTDPAVRESLLAAARALADIQSTWLAKPLAFIAGLFSLTAPVSTGITINAAPLSDLLKWLQARTADADRVMEWSRFLVACDLAAKQNLATLRDELLSGAIPIPQAQAAFDRAFYLAWLQETYAREPLLSGFDLARHNTHLQTFKRLDRFWVHNAFTRVRSKVLSQSVRVSGLDAIAPDSSEVGILLREANKKRSHLPIRRLFAAIPRLLLRIKPCIMMSPLSVSTFLDSDDLRFDVVIFDEASQVRPHDAVCSVYRGRQLVVAGDQKQLPPTDFFEKITDHDSTDEEADEEAHTTRDFESILDVCATLPMTRQRLKWHYRSKRESLIAFSNRYFYENQLVTFPSCLDVHGSSGATLVHVPTGRWSGQSAGGGVNAEEALTLARAVIRHAQENPAQSLGVITMNQAQQLRVIDEIDNLRKALLNSSPLDPGHGTSDAGLTSFFSPDNPEPFFVKNLENVQGDERDIIFFGVGYAKNEAGTLSHNFGPLNRQGGERRLNVAVTRARLSLTLFSSILAQDIDLTRTQSNGARLLKAYLDFASRGPAALQAPVPSSSAAVETHLVFEDQVAAALQANNLHIQRQVGCSTFKVDLALTDPADPSRFVLGIECDGPSYRDAASARDRDRLREQVLQSLGWRILRIWSTDWAKDPARQLAIILHAYQNALTGGPPLPPQPIPTLNPLPASAVPPTEAPKPDDFDKIDQVPPDVISQTLLDVLNQFGAMSTDDLFLTSAKKLGFARTGPRIKESFTLALADLIQQQKALPTPEGKIKPV